MEIDIDRLQEAILEVVEVKKHGVGIKLRLRIAVAPVQSSRSANLEVGELAYGLHEQLFLLLGISASCLATSTKGIEERHVAQVFLKVAHLVVGDGKHLGNRQLAMGEVACQINKGVVLVATCAQHSYYCPTLAVGKAVILSVAACASQFLRCGR